MAVLFLRNVTLPVWIQSPGPAIIHGTGGKLVDLPGKPGILFLYPTVRAAAQAALRVHAEQEVFWEPQGVPSMSIDTESDPTIAILLSLEVAAKVVAITKRAARELGTDPLEFLPGPSVRGPDGRDLPSMFLPASTVNVGWALPTLQTLDVRGQNISPAATLPASPYLRKTEPSVINIQMEAKGKGLGLPFAFPWKLTFLCLVLYLFIFGLYRMTKGILNSRREPVAEATPNLADLTKKDMTSVLVIPTREPTQEPLGFATVVINTEPKDAKVYVNEELRGKKSPVILEKQPNNDVFRLSVKRRGYKEYTKIYNVESDQRMVLTVKLEKEMK